MRYIKLSRKVWLSIKRILTLILAFMLVILMLGSCKQQNDVNALPTETVLSEERQEPTPSVIIDAPTVTLKDEFSISIDRDQYPKDVEIIQFTLHITEGKQVYGINMPELEHWKNDKWEYIPTMIKCGVMDPLEDGEIVNLPLGGASLESGKYRAYLDVHTEQGDKNATRLYAYFTLTEGTIAIARPDVYKVGVSSITIALDNTNTPGSVMIEENLISMQEGRDWIGYGSGTVEETVELMQGERLEIDIALYQSLTKAGIYQVELWLVRSDWGGEPIREYRKVIFKVN